MGNTCKPMAVSFHCMTKFTTIKKKESEKKKKPHTYGIWEDANNDSICKAAKETQILKKKSTTTTTTTSTTTTDFWILWMKARVG